MTLDNPYKTVGKFGRELLEETAIEEGLPKIASYTKSIIGADRCSVFVYDDKERILWTTLADGVDRIVIPSDRGIIGRTIATKKGIVENDPYSNPHFDRSVDEETGYKTRNILTAPIFDSAGRILSAIQLLNKDDGDFDSSDSDFLRFFTYFISGYLELLIVHACEENYFGENC